VTDYTPGDAPVLVGTVVRYGQRKIQTLYRITEILEPYPCPDQEIHYPDGVAYALWPAGVPHKFGNRHLSVYNVRRTSFTIEKNNEKE
jgi:hypothetical protein